MTEAVTRSIFRSSIHCRSEIRELLEGIFVRELLSPSPEFFIVSPWVSDIAVIDNRANAYTDILPQSGPREVRLGEVLRVMLRSGANVCLAIRPDRHNDKLIDTLVSRAQADRTDEQLTIASEKDLHEKGICGADYYLNGSMNLTYNGIEVLEESVKYVTDPSEVSRVQVTYQEHWMRKNR